MDYFSFSRTPVFSKRTKRKIKQRPCTDYIKEITPKSPLLCVHRSHIRYGFRTGAKDIRCTVNTIRITPKIVTSLTCEYPGCQRLLMRGFRFQSVLTLKKVTRAKSFAARDFGLRPTKRSSPSHARNNFWYPG